MRVRSRWKPVAAKMAPGADVGGAANRQVGDASMGLRSAVKGSQVRVGEKNSEGSGDAPLLSARERLRLHVNRNLAMQQHEAQVGGASDKGPASAGGPSAPPRGASPANSNTPPPNHPRQQSNGLDSLYGPITDTRLGRGDISQGHGSSEFAREGSTTVAEGGDMIDVPLNMSIDMGDPFVKASPLGHFFCCACSCFAIFLSTENIASNKKSLVPGFCLAVESSPLPPAFGIPLPIPR